MTDSRPVLNFSFQPYDLVIFLLTRGFVPILQSLVRIGRFRFLKGLHNLCERVFFGTEPSVLPFQMSRDKGRCVTADILERPGTQSRARLPSRALISFSIRSTPQGL